MKPKILVLCTGNSCRSQMAEAWINHFFMGRLEGYSAGVDPKGIDPNAVRAMGEHGLDLTGNSSKHVDALAGIDFDFVITVCGHAAENCPTYPAPTRLLHHAFDDPPRLAAGARSDEARMAPYRRVCLEIKEFVQKLPELLKLDPET